jgi:hypothetical protein
LSARRKWRPPPPRQNPHYLENIAIDFNAGLTPEQIIDKKPHLTLARINGELPYSSANQDDIDADLAAENAEWERWESQYTTKLKP